MPHDQYITLGLTSISVSAFTQYNILSHDAKLTWCIQIHSGLGLDVAQCHALNLCTQPRLYDHSPNQQGAVPRELHLRVKMSEYSMQCDICFRTGGHRLPFLCPVDARNQLYEPRVAHAQALLEKDELDRQVKDLLSCTDSLLKDGTEDSTPITRAAIGQIHTERDVVRDRTQQIIAQADDLRMKIENARKEISEKRDKIARRKSEYASASNGLEARRNKLVEDIEKKTKMMQYKWNQLHSTTAQARAFLCGEAAKLYGLQRMRDPEGGWTTQFSIAGVPIVDLRSMNGASAAQITVSLSHIAHLLVLSTHYLAIRLPAEITLPHRDYPLPTILSVSSSYMYSNIPFPSSTFYSSSNSPSSSRHGEFSNLPRPRPLFVPKPLPLLAKDDPSDYSTFLEGVTLLAYNIAWVCKSQNVPVGSSTTASTTFEDMCCLGQNLYNLLIGSSLRTNLLTRTSSAKSSPLGVSTAAIGQRSHGSAHNFLAGTSGQEFVRTFKLPNPTKIADRLKSQLLSEVASAEWEVVDRGSWTEREGHADDVEGDGVMVGARRAESLRGLSGDHTAYRNTIGNLGMREISDVGAQSFMSLKTVVDAVEIMDGATDERKAPPGTSGWTKVKPR